MQARLIAAAPKLMRIARELAEFADEHSSEIPEEILRLGRAADSILRSVAETPSGSPTPQQPGVAAA